jgi:hypothetical protein
VKPNPSGIWPRARYVASLLLLIGAAVFAQALPQIIQAPNPPNAAAQQEKPYVVLVSLDGFRYDYVKKYSAPNIVALANRGATAPDGMIPSYPSLTFPNHYAIVSGLKTSQNNKASPIPFGSSTRLGCCVPGRISNRSV